MPKRKVYKPKLRESDIAFLSQEKLKITAARTILKRLPMNDSVRTALAAAGIPRDISRYLQDNAGVEVLLDLRWRTIRDTFEHFFDTADVDRVFRDIEPS